MSIRIAACCLLFLALLPACTGRRVIRPDGLGFVRLGDPMPEPGRLRWQGRDLRDTLFLAEDFTWRAAVLQYDGGKVYIEADFLGQETVNRIRIESPELRYRRQLQVGSTVAELQAAFPEWDLTPLPAYGYLDLSPLARPSLHFLIPAQPGEPPAHIGDLSPETRVVAIVVM